MQTLLAIQSSQVPLVFQHPLSSLVSSLPYCDGDLNSSITYEVTRLINEEMKSMEKKDYLENLNLKKSDFVQQGSIIESELQRIARREALSDISLENYDLKNLREDPQSLDESIKKAKIIHEHTQSQLLNLELMNRYGASNWKEYVLQSEKLPSFFQNAISGKRNNLNEVNAKRKYEQIEAKEKIEGYDVQIKYMLNKNCALECEIAKLENEINDIRFKKIKVDKKE